MVNDKWSSDATPSPSTSAPASPLPASEMSPTAAYKALEQPVACYGSDKGQPLVNNPWGEFVSRENFIAMHFC